MTKIQGIGVLLLGSLVVAAVPASAGGLLGGSVGGVAGSVTSSIGGAGGLGASGAPLGGLGGGLTGGASGSGNGLLGATISRNGVPPGTGAGLVRPLHGATGKLRSATDRPWGTFEDAKGLEKGKVTSAFDRAAGLVPKGAALTNGPLLANAPRKGQAGGSAQASRSKRSGLRRSLEGTVLSRSIALPEGTLDGGKADANGGARASGRAEARRANVASSGRGSVDVEASAK